MMTDQTIQQSTDEHEEFKTRWILNQKGNGEVRPRHARPGERCPTCGEGVLDYDGMLNLVCPVCPFVEGGCFT